jgi:sigma-B regulation protein RsbU (phosphoserine phosphatase)
VVSQAATRLRDAMREHADNWDQSLLIRDLNNAFFKSSENTLEFATAFLIAYYGQTGELVFTNAGHPHPLWYRAAKREWILLQDSTPLSKSIADLPLGLIPGTLYTQTGLELDQGDLLLLYTDGVSESVNDAGKQLGLKGLLNLARQLPTTSPAGVGTALLAAIEDYRGGSSAADDETVIVLRRTEIAPNPVVDAAES